MIYKPDVNTTIERMRAFWSKDLLDRPPIRVRYPVPGQSDEQWPKASQDPIALYEYWDHICRGRAQFPDDEIPAIHLDMGPGFMGGVLGAPVMYDHGTTWSEHTLESSWDALDDIEKIPIDASNPWLNKLVKASEHFARQSEGKCAVGLALVVGPGDIMTALRGPNQICLDFHDSPAELTRLAQLSVETWVKTVRLQFATVPSFENGFIDNYNIWTPGKNTYFTNDISNLVSPELYREHLFPYDCQIAETMEAGWLHVHSGGARLVPEFRKMPNLKGIQIVNDRPAGPKAGDLLPIFKMIQKNHCLLLRKYDKEELEQIIPELSAEGLYVDTQADSPEKAFELLQWWEAQFS